MLILGGPFSTGLSQTTVITKRVHKFQKNTKKPFSNILEQGFFCYFKGIIYAHNMRVFIIEVLLVSSKEVILNEIKKLNLPYEALSERQQKSLLASIAMKMIYEPLTKAVIECFKPFEKELNQSSK